MSSGTRQKSSTTSPSRADHFTSIRGFTQQLSSTLTPEDCALQSMPDASPVRWHLAHTSWFFETFLLKQDASYQPFDPHYEVLFNSYYNTVGEQFPRARRGLLSRPSLSDVFAYREHVDWHVLDWIESGRLEELDSQERTRWDQVLEIGLQHEQQHQELLLTDVKHLFSLNPLQPTFREAGSQGALPLAPALEWSSISEGVYEIGCSLDCSLENSSRSSLVNSGEPFAYDNESPRHRVFLEPFQIASRAVTSGQFLEFLLDDGYARPELWLSLGWNRVKQQEWSHPLYWYEQDGVWHDFTLAGPKPLDREAPVCHVSYFEADAFARWAGARLPTEAEWEVTAAAVSNTGNFANTLLATNRALHPSAPSPEGDQPNQMFGDVWEWTASPYTPYPGYQAAKGALGEYNGKFMCNQYVLRGGSVATSSSHIRATYRNFFPPEARWQFSGLRLAK